jgi:hypothetical protein
MRMAERFNFFQHQSIEFGRAQARVQMAEQLAHDIRSPLSALNIISATIKELPQEKREFIQSVSERINCCSSGKVTLELFLINLNRKTSL